MIKKKFISLVCFSIVLCGIYSVQADILIYNVSNIPIDALVTRGGCSDECHPKSGGQVPLCCAWIGGNETIGRKGYASDKSPVGVLGMNGGAPSWTWFYSDYNVTVYALDNSGRTWEVKNVKPTGVLFFPNSFNVTDAEVAALSVGYPQTPSSQYVSKGSFSSVTNATSDIIATPLGQIPANGLLEFTNINPKGLSFNKGSTITFNDSIASVAYTFSFSNNILTLQGTVTSSQTVTYEAQFYLASLFESYEINESQINNYDISLNITQNFAPTISQITINLDTPSQSKGSSSGSKTIVLSEQELINKHLLNVIQSEQ